MLLTGLKPKGVDIGDVVRRLRQIELLLSEIQQEGPLFSVGLQRRERTPRALESSAVGRCRDSGGRRFLLRRHGRFGGCVDGRGRWRRVYRCGGWTIAAAPAR